MVQDTKLLLQLRKHAVPLVFFADVIMKHLFKDSRFCYERKQQDTPSASEIKKSFADQLRTMSTWISITLVPVLFLPRQGFFFAFGIVFWGPAAS